MKNIIARVLFYIFRIFKIQKNKIIILNYNGRGYGDNAKYICEELLKLNVKFEIVWVIDNLASIETLPSGVGFVKYKSIKYIYEMATAKVWINNCRMSNYVRKRKGQYYIQTWHGGIPLKKVEFDAYDNLSFAYQKNMINDNKMIDLMVSNSKFTNDLFNSGFHYSGEIITEGVPRNDFFVNNIVELEKKCRSKLNIDNKRVLLYVPTFRDSYEDNPYDIDYVRLRNKLREVTHEEWVILIKFHPNIKDSSVFIKESDAGIIDVSSYDDTQELEASSDLIITDYSSLMFEGLEINKPIILYIKDYGNYKKKNRDLYFEIHKLPFKKAYNNDELNEIIEKNSLKDLTAEYSDFYERLGINETGKSSKKIAEIIKKITE